MRNAEKIKELIEYRRENWGFRLIDEEEFITYDKKLHYNIEGYNTYTFNPNSSVWVNPWIRDLKKYQAEMANGTLQIEGETVESLQADIDIFEQQAKDTDDWNNLYKNWTKANKNVKIENPYKDTDDDDEEEEDDDEE